MSFASFAQKEVTVKAGTLVPLQITNPTKAADVSVGQKVAFRVSRDIKVDGVTAIPYGTIVNGTVYQAKRSSWWGTAAGSADRAEPDRSADIPAGSSDTKVPRAGC